MKLSPMKVTLELLATVSLVRLILKGVPRKDLLLHAGRCAALADEDWAMVSHGVSVITEKNWVQDRGNGE